MFQLDVDGEVVLVDSLGVAEELAAATLSAVVLGGVAGSATVAFEERGGTSARGPEMAPMSAAPSFGSAGGRGAGRLLVRALLQHGPRTIKYFPQEIIKDKDEPFDRPAKTARKILLERNAPRGVRRLRSARCQPWRICIHERDVYLICLILPFSSKPPIADHATHPTSWATASKYCSIVGLMFLSLLPTQRSVV